MKRDNAETLAAEYVLGTLDAGARQQFERQLAADLSSREQRDGWERRLMPLIDTLLPEQPSASVWSAIEAAVDDTETKPRGTDTIRAAEGQWQILAPGIEKKLLMADPVQRTQSFLLRVAAGSRYPAHVHTATEECFVIAGDVRIGEMNLAAGDYHVADAGTAHPELFSQNGGLMFIRGELG